MDSTRKARAFTMGAIVLTAAALGACSAVVSIAGGCQDDNPILEATFSEARASNCSNLDQEAMEDVRELSFSWREVDGKLTARHVRDRQSGHFGAVRLRLR